MNHDIHAAPGGMAHAGLTHLGLDYDTPGEFVSAVLPQLNGALDRGHAVAMLVDHHVSQRIREEVATAEGLNRISFEPPTRSQVSPHAFHGHLRSLSHRNRRTLVITQYSALGAGERACAQMEDGINLVLSDAGITLVCACARDLGPGMLATARRSHPGWIASGGPASNPDFRPPRGDCPVPSRVWGPPVLRLLFRDTGDLLDLRHEIARVASDVGLRGDDAQAAVLAVHEAAVLTCRTPDRPAGPPGRPSTHAGDQPSDAGVERLLEVRVSRTAMFSEILVPGCVGHADGTQSIDTGGGADPVDDIRWFCRYAAVHDSVSGRAIRVLTDLRRSATR